MMQHPHFETFAQRDRVAFVDEIAKDIARFDAERKARKASAFWRFTNGRAVRTLRRRSRHYLGFARLHSGCDRWGVLDAPQQAGMVSIS